MNGANRPVASRVSGSSGTLTCAEFVLTAGSPDAVGLS
jgi:hypothetical protein